MKITVKTTVITSETSTGREVVIKDAEVVTNVNEFDMEEVRAKTMKSLGRVADNIEQMVKARYADDA